MRPCSSSEVPNATSTHALRSISEGSRPASRAAALMRSLSAANPSGLLPKSSYQVFHASTCGSAMESIRGPLLPIIRRGGSGGAGRKTASSAWQ